MIQNDDAPSTSSSTFVLMVDFVKSANRLFLESSTSVHREPHVIPAAGDLNRLVAASPASVDTQRVSSGLDTLKGETAVPSAMTTYGVSATKIWADIVG
jgi:hypothetical protein